MNRPCASSQTRPKHPPQPFPATLDTSAPDFLHPACVFLQGARTLIFRAVEDTDLIRQASRGSVESYNLLVSRWEKRVYNYLLRITGNREDALDLAQDVFLEGLSEPPQTR